MFNKLLAFLFLSCPLWAAVNCTNLDTGADATVATTHTTGPVAPLDNALLLIAINNNRNSGNGGEVPTSVTYNGTSLALTSVGTVELGSVVGSGHQHRISLYRAMGTTLGTDTITIVFTNTQVVRWSVDQCTGVDTTGTNGSGAIVQAVTNSGSSVQPSTVTMAAFADSGNGTYGASGYNNQSATFSPGTGLTIIGDAQSTYEMITEWAPGNVTPVETNWSATVFAWGQIGVELKAAPASIPSIMVGGLIQVN